MLGHDRSQHPDHVEVFAGGEVLEAVARGDAPPVEPICVSYDRNTLNLLTAACVAALGYCDYRGEVAR